jgi:uncharacterized protein YkwD
MKSSLFRLFLSLLFLIPALVSFRPEPGSTAASEVLTYTNQFRKAHGLKPVIMHEGLNAIAQKHSEDMAKKRVGFGHAGADRRYKQARRQIPAANYFAENVAYGVSTGKAAVMGWKKSPGHRKNLLGRYKYMGVGIAKDRNGRIYYTQVFAG